jgi:hypothetical protein
MRVHVRVPAYKLMFLEKSCIASFRPHLATFQLTSRSADVIRNSCQQLDRYTCLTRHCHCQLCHPHVFVIKGAQAALGMHISELGMWLFSG